MTKPIFRSRLLMLAALAVALSGCTQAVDSSNEAAQNAKQAVSDAKDKWSDLLTYHPRSKEPQMPQTRYCYQMQSDIVCYDSAQPSLTAALVGYQDGPNRAWFQPGGGSTGYSGGPATSIYPQGNIMPLTGSSADHSNKTYAAVGSAGVDEITTTSNMPSGKTVAPK